MTNRELLQKAMPLTSLSREQWNVFQKHLESIKEPVLLSALKLLEQNQCRLEIIDNYINYYSDTLNEEVIEENLHNLQTA